MMQNISSEQILWFSLPNFDHHRQSLIKFTSRIQFQQECCGGHVGLVLLTYCEILCFWQRPISQKQQYVLLLPILLLNIGMRRKSLRTSSNDNIFLNGFLFYLKLGNIKVVEGLGRVQEQLLTKRVCIITVFRQHSSRCVSCPLVCVCVRVLVHFHFNLVSSVLAPFQRSQFRWCEMTIELEPLFYNRTDR